MAPAQIDTSAMGCLEGGHAVDRSCPVVMSVTPHGKDVLPDWIHMILIIPWEGTG
jgi:hypothetical protein